MVNRKNIKKFALISVYNKNKLIKLCRNLKKHNFSFIATSSTFKKIKSLGFNCFEISKLTKFNEILDGRVKTLHPKIHASILHKRNDTSHLNDFKKLNFPSIDLVIVNLYPFEKILKKNSKYDDILEMIDIGGVSLIRSSGKNFEHTTTISEIDDYDKLIENMKKNKGITSIDFRKKMAVKAYQKTSRYDLLISKWLREEKIKKNSYQKNKLILRYGENPDQKSHILINKHNPISKFQINGKKLSYNNILDVDSGYNCLSEFKEPTCVIIKHTNPCGVASRSKIKDAFISALEADSKSAFGGIVLLNRKVDEVLANIIKEFFFEIILAPQFTKSAERILKAKKKLILLEVNNIKNNYYEHKSTIFGTLYQKKNLEIINRKILKSFSKLSSKKDIVNDLIFSLKVVKHIKSNAIVLSKNKTTLGIGMGQTNRIGSLDIALKKIKQNDKKANFVCASDGFFPFTDGIRLLQKSKCKAIVQPSGSINDTKIINFAKKNKINLYFVKKRFFKH